MWMFHPAPWQPLLFCPLCSHLHTTSMHSQELWHLWGKGTLGRKISECLLSTCLKIRRKKEMEFFTTWTCIFRILLTISIPKHSVFLEQWRHLVDWCHKQAGHTSESLVRIKIKSIDCNREFCVSKPQRNSGCRLCLCVRYWIKLLWESSSRQAKMEWMGQKDTGWKKTYSYTLFERGS